MPSLKIKIREFLRPKDRNTQQYQYPNVGLITIFEQHHEEDNRDNNRPKKI